MSDAGLLAMEMWRRDKQVRVDLGASLAGAFVYETWAEVKGDHQAHYLAVADLLLQRLQDKEDLTAKADLPDLARTYRHILRRWLNKLDRATSRPDVDGSILELMDAQLKKCADALDKLSAVEVRIKRESLEEWARMSIRDKADRMLQEIQSWPETSKDEFRDRFEVACPGRKLKAVR
jgi:hypothetical protein